MIIKSDDIVTFAYVNHYMSVAKPLTPVCNMLDEKNELNKAIDEDKHFTIDCRVEIIKPYSYTNEVDTS